MTIKAIEDQLHNLAASTLALESMRAHRKELLDELKRLQRWRCLSCISTNIECLLRRDAWRYP